jgi:hypothetical protein
MTLDGYDNISKHNDRLLRSFMKSYRVFSRFFTPKNIDVLQKETREKMKSYLDEFKALKTELQVESLTTDWNNGDSKPWEIVHSDFYNLFSITANVCTEILHDTYSNSEWDYGEVSMIGGLEIRRRWINTIPHTTALGSETQPPSEHKNHQAIRNVLHKFHIYRYKLALNDSFSYMRRVDTDTYEGLVETRKNHDPPTMLDIFAKAKISASANQIHNEQKELENLGDEIWSQQIQSEDMKHERSKQFFVISLKELTILSESEEKITESWGLESDDTLLKDVNKSMTSSVLSEMYFKFELHPNNHLCSQILDGITHYSDHFKELRNGEDNPHKERIELLSKLVHGISFMFKPYVLSKLEQHVSVFDDDEKRSLRRCFEFITCMVLWFSIIPNCTELKAWIDMSNKFKSKYVESLTAVSKIDINELYKMRKATTPGEFELTNDENLGESAKRIWDWIHIHDLHCFTAANLYPGKIEKISRFKTREDYDSDESEAKNLTKSQWGDLKIIIRQDSKFVIIIEKHLTKEQKKNIHTGSEIMLVNLATKEPVNVSETELFKSTAIMLPSVSGELLSVKMKKLMPLLRAYSVDESVMGHKITDFFKPIQNFLFLQENISIQPKLKCSMGKKHFKTSFCLSGEAKLDSNTQMVIDGHLEKATHMLCSTHIHGDEWGNNFIVFNNNLIPIDLEDVVFTDDKDFTTLKTCGGMLGLRSFNKHLVNNSIKYKKPEVITDLTALKSSNTLSYAPFNTCSSYGRLLAALLQKQDDVVRYETQLIFLRYALEIPLKASEENLSSYKTQILLAVYDWTCYWADKHGRTLVDFNNRAIMKDVIQNLLDPEHEFMVSKNI